MECTVKSFRGLRVGDAQTDSVEGVQVDQVDGSGTPRPERDDRGEWLGQEQFDFVLQNAQCDDDEDKRPSKFCFRIWICSFYLSLRIEGNFHDRWAIDLR